MHENHLAPQPPSASRLPELEMKAAAGRRRAASEASQTRWHTAHCSRAVGQQTSEPQLALPVEVQTAQVHSLQGCWGEGGYW